MGTFTVSIQVGDLAGQQFVDIEALVDTGATYTVLPKEMLDQLGIAQEGQRRFELGDDRIVEHPIGYARVLRWVSRDRQENVFVGRQWEIGEYSFKSRRSC